jgi:hypothetical protein
MSDMIPTGLDVVVTREFGRAGGGPLVHLLVARPERDPEAGGDWRCRHVILGLGPTVDRYAYGIDGLQALALTLEMARAELEAAAQAGNAVTWLGGEDLDLPRSLPGVG